MGILLYVHLSCTNLGSEYITSTTLQLSFASIREVELHEQTQNH